jgi:hypothetical protein
MTRIRRISLRVERREISLSITQAGTTPGEAGEAQTPNNAIPPNACPDCGSPWLPDLQKALLDGKIELNLLQSAILAHRLHLQRGPDGELWVCERSLEQIKEAT